MKKCCHTNLQQMCVLPMPNSHLWQKIINVGPQSWWKWKANHRKTSHSSVSMNWLPILTDVVYQILHLIRIAGDWVSKVNTIVDRKGIGTDCPTMICSSWIKFIQVALVYWWLWMMHFSAVEAENDVTAWILSKWYRFVLYFKWDGVKSLNVHRWLKI